MTTKNKFGELVYDRKDLVNFIMQGNSLESLIVDEQVQVDNSMLDNPVTFLLQTDSQYSVEQFDHANQTNWYMPEEYKTLDIAEYLLSRCTTDAELQRVGHELLLYNERNLFGLLQYLKYLVDVMKQHGIIWGVGRGSSVASYVLYLLEIHQVDSIYYDLQPEEFLR